MTELTTTRDVTPAECWWLTETIPAGIELHRFTQPTYGCVGPMGLAVSLTGDYPFFEIPKDALMEVTRR